MIKKLFSKKKAIFRPCVAIFNHFTLCSYNCQLLMLKRTIPGQKRQQRLHRIKQLRLSTSHSRLRVIPGQPLPRRVPPKLVSPRREICCRLISAHCKLDIRPSLNRPRLFKLHQPLPIKRKIAHMITFFRKQWNGAWEQKPKTRLPILAPQTFTIILTTKTL